MSDPITTGGGILSGKLSAILFSLGGALATLAFYEPIDTALPRWKVYFLSVFNVTMSWFIGYVMGGAIVEFLEIENNTNISNGIYTLSAIVGLVLVGAAYRLAHQIKNDPQGTIVRWLRKGNRNK